MSCRHMHWTPLSDLALLSMGRASPVESLHQLAFEAETGRGDKGFIAKANRNECLSLTNDTTNCWGALVVQAKPA